MTKRRNFSDQFKAAVALEALPGDKTVREIAAKRQLHPTQVSTWKRQAIEGEHRFTLQQPKFFSQSTPSRNLAQ
jgi:transposase